MHDLECVSKLRYVAAGLQTRLGRRVSKRGATVILKRTVLRIALPRRDAVLNAHLMRICAVFLSA